MKDFAFYLSMAQGNALAATAPGIRTDRRLMRITMALAAMKLALRCQKEA